MCVGTIRNQVKALARYAIGFRHGVGVVPRADPDIVAAPHQFAFHALHIGGKPASGKAGGQQPRAQSVFKVVRVVDDELVLQQMFRQWIDPGMREYDHVGLLDALVQRLNELRRQARHPRKADIDDRTSGNELLQPCRGFVLPGRERQHAGVPRRLWPFVRAGRTGPVVGADVFGGEVLRQFLADFFHAHSCAADCRLQHLVVGDEDAHRLACRLHQRRQTSRFRLDNLGRLSALPTPPRAGARRSAPTIVRARSAGQLRPSPARVCRSAISVSHGVGQRRRIGIDDESRLAMLHQQRRLA